MKKTTSIGILFIATVLFGQVGIRAPGENKNILRSTNIQQIEKYLETAHPDNPKRGILKRKIVQLKNEHWVKGAKNAKPMAARPLDGQNDLIGYSIEDAEEFKKMMLETLSGHQEKTVQLLNNLFNEDALHNEAIFLMKNYSDCNIIMKIHGREQYKMAIPSKGENFIIVKKGDYTLSSNICNIQYKALKKINKGLFVELSPTVPAILKKNMNK